MDLGGSVWIIGNESKTHRRRTKKRVKEIKDYYWPLSKVLFPELYKGKYKNK